MQLRHSNTALAAASQTLSLSCRPEAKTGSHRPLLPAVASAAATIRAAPPPPMPTRARRLCVVCQSACMATEWNETERNGIEWNEELEAASLLLPLLLLLFARVESSRGIVVVAGGGGGGFGARTAKGKAWQKS